MKMIEKKGREGKERKKLGIEGRGMDIERKERNEVK